MEAHFIKNVSYIKICLFIYYKIKDFVIFQVGIWSTSKGLNFTQPLEKAKTGGLFGNKTLIVTSILVSKSN